METNLELLRLGVETKTKERSVPSFHQWFSLCTVHPNCEKHGNYWSDSSWGYIQYETGPRGKEKSCVHVKAKAVNFDNQISTLTVLPDHVYTGNEYSIPLCKDVVLPLLGQIRDPLSDGYLIAAMKIKAAKKAKEQAGHPGSPLSIANFIIELKEWKSYVQAYGKAFRRYNKIGRDLFRNEGFDSWARHARLQNPRAIRDALIYDVEQGLAKNLANKVLEVNFNLRPLYADCLSLLNCHLNLRDALDKLKAQEGQLLRVRVKEDIAESPDAYIIEDRGGGSKAMWIMYEFTTRVAMNLTFKYSLPAISDDEAMWKLCLDYLGLSKNQLATVAKVAWNAYPFTFVVDWFVKVGDFIESFEEPNYPVILSPHRCQISRKSLFKAGFRYLKLGELNPSEPYKVYKYVDGSVYYRYGDIGCTIDQLETVLPPKIGKFSLLKLLNGTALTSQFIIPRRMRT